MEKSTLIFSFVDSTIFKKMRSEAMPEGLIAHGFGTQVIDRSYVWQLIRLQHELLAELEQN